MLVPKEQLKYVVVDSCGANGVNVYQGSRDLVNLSVRYIVYC